MKSLELNAWDLEEVSVSVKVLLLMVVRLVYRGK